MNDYLAYQGLRQERDALRAENEKLLEAAEAMRAKCEKIVREAIERWEDAMHTDDGDVYCDALSAQAVLHPVRDALAALKAKP